MWEGKIFLKSIFIFPLKHLILLKGSLILKLKTSIWALKRLILSNILDFGQISGSLILDRNYATSQNYRIAEVGRECLRGTWSKPLF